MNSSRPSVMQLWRRLVSNQSGASVVEFAIVSMLFFALVFFIIDMGLIAWQWNNASKAAQVGARLAAVRPAVCPGVPQVFSRRSDITNAGDAPAGTNCATQNNSSSVCQQITISCTGTVAQANLPTEFNEIWTNMGLFLPIGATPANVQFTYQSRPELGFINGPWIGMVTVQLGNPDATPPVPRVPFQFLTPVPYMMAYLSLGGGTGIGGQVLIPPMRSTVPTEDLAHGEAG